MDIKIPDNLAAELKARAEAQGRDPEAYTIGLLWRAVVELDPLVPKKKVTKKAPVRSNVSEHDFSHIFRFGEPTENGPTIDDLSKPVRFSKE